MGSDRVLHGDRGYRYSADLNDVKSDLSLQKITLYGFALIWAAHVLLKQFDLAILSPVELIWNALVYIMPRSLIDMLARATNSSAAQLELANVQSQSQLHASKSNALRQLLRLPGTAHAPRDTMDEDDDNSSPLSSVKSASDVPPGLGNWDNSCYQNSVLQSLAAIPSVLSFLDEAITSLPNSADTTTGTLHELTNDLTTNTNNGKRIWTPAKLKSMSSWQQQDAQEYYSRVLSDIEKELKGISLRRSSNAGLRGVAPGMDAASARKSRSLSEQQQIVSMPLEGLLGQRVACVACGYTEGVTLLPFNCLTVTPGSRNGYALEELLDEYTKLESIEQVECLSCTFTRHAARLEAMLGSTWGSDSVERKTLPPAVQQMIAERLERVREAIMDHDFTDKIAKQVAITKEARVSSTKTKQVVVARAPQSLAIHVNRSTFNEMTGDMTKNHAYIAFPKELYLAPWTLGKAALGDRDAIESWPIDPETSLASQQPDDTAGSQYELKAVVSHFGRHENGHYICYRQHNRSASNKVSPQLSPQWWRLSDETVTRATEDEVLHQGGVFMLFYERVAKLDRAVSEQISDDIAAEALAPQAVATDDDEVATLDERPASSAEQHTLHATSASSPVVSAPLAEEDAARSSTAEAVLPIEQTVLQPRALRTSSLGANTTQDHMQAGMPFVAAQ